MQIVIFSIVPSPYQRDLFKSLSQEVDLKVFYLEPQSPDSPWPKKELEDYESILSGTYLNFKGMRFFLNWQFPSLEKTDLVVLNGYMGILFQWLMRFRSKSIPLIFWGERMVDQPRSLKGKLQKWMSRPLMNCCAIVAIGQRAQSEYAKRFPKLPVYNIPYHCDLSEFQLLPLRKPAASIRFLFCGQMIYRKGMDILLKAFEKLIDYDITLHLVGREAELPNMLSQMSDACRSKIVYHGFQPPDRLPFFFDMADVFILPSRYDGWGVVVNQALGSGLPVICSDQVGAGSMITPGEQGYLFKAGDVEKLYQVMLFFIKNSDKINLMSKKAREYSFTILPEQGVLKWLNVINELRRDTVKSGQ